MHIYANENFPAPAVRHLRSLGHNVVTTADAGNANLKIPDEDVVTFANDHDRVVLTLNRKDFIRIHGTGQPHKGIVVCHEDIDFVRLANRIHTAIDGRNLVAQLVELPKP